MAIPIIMGANIGTSVTGVIVSVTQAGDKVTFQRAFSAATVHDMFNWLTVIILLPVEVITGYLYHVTSAIVDSTNLAGGGEEQQFLSVLTDPFTELIVQVNKVLSRYRSMLCVECTGKLFSSNRYNINRRLSRYSYNVNRSMQCVDSTCTLLPSHRYNINTHLLG